MIRSFTGRLLRRTGAPPLPGPDTPLVAVGDIHGCDDRLGELLELIGAWLDAETRLVFLGDVVDRGPDSRAVIDRLMALAGAQPDRVEVLTGNHERMMLDFLAGEDPGGRWLANGGVQTLQSFGLEVPPAEGLAPGALEDLRTAARRAVGTARTGWLGARPLYVLSGDVVLVHAAWETRRSAERQDPAQLIWGSREFYRHRRSAPPWVVHGHVITRPARIEGTRIAIDSGAYLGGGLTAVRLVPGREPEFRTAGAPDPA
ncbi:metallophosphoesterase [Poseidonocella sp. HB161398]|uniref:metallophosphoesterase n=1 Tax=Poseidonocella sp. HB161398 TaxID=2320855 RepID=UPI0014865FB5|nr:metallophosphoesterase [Poseidonocella sp. HB161398]